jgi:hypothetical protein
LFERAPLRARQLPDGSGLQFHLEGFHRVEPLVRVAAGEQLIRDACECINVIANVRLLALQHLEAGICRRHGSELSGIEQCCVTFFQQ